MPSTGTPVREAFRPGEGRVGLTNERGSTRRRPHRHVEIVVSTSMYCRRRDTFLSHRLTASSPSRRAVTSSVSNRGGLRRLSTYA